ncbi:MAG: hypothetical protein Q7U74_16135 [Saprospiraceae bacterium]|nr:hypothetical protein [Saprospiraceae bacterium]
MANIEKRLKDIESEFSPDKKFIVAYHNDETKDIYTVKGKEMTRAELDAISDPDTTIIFIVRYDSKPLPGKGEGLEV